MFFLVISVICFLIQLKLMFFKVDENDKNTITLFLQNLNHPDLWIKLWLRSVSSPTHYIWFTLVSFTLRKPYIINTYALNQSLKKNLRQDHPRMGYDDNKISWMIIYLRVSRQYYYSLINIQSFSKLHHIIISK